MPGPAEWIDAKKAGFPFDFRFGATWEIRTKNSW